MDKTPDLHPRFDLGHTVFTPGVERLLKFPSMAGVELAPLLNRHRAGDWGDMCQQDKDSNEHALEVGLRLMSAYELYGEKVWVITEADRSVTTFLLPEEY